MSKWEEKLYGKFRDTKTIRKLTNEIKDALNKKKFQKEVDQNITSVLKGKYVRRGY